MEIRVIYGFVWARYLWQITCLWPKTYLNLFLIRYHLAVQFMMINSLGLLETCRILLDNDDDRDLGDAFVPLQEASGELALCTQ